MSDPTPTSARAADGIGMLDNIVPREPGQPFMDGWRGQLGFVAAWAAFTVCVLGIYNGTRASIASKDVRTGVAIVWDSSFSKPDYDRAKRYDGGGVTVVDTANGLVVTRSVTAMACRHLLEDLPPHVAAVAAVPAIVTNPLDYAQAVKTLMPPVTGPVVDKMCDGDVTMLMLVARPLQGQNAKQTN